MHNLIQTCTSGVNVARDKCGERVAEVIILQTVGQCPSPEIQMGDVSANKPEAQLQTASGSVVNHTAGPTVASHDHLDV